MGFDWSPVIAAGASAASSVGGSFLSSWLGSSSSKKAQKRAYNYWRSSLQEGPMLTRQGLEAAGYNPMLALGSLGSQSFSSSSAPSFAPVGDIVGGAKQGAELANQIKKGFKLQNKKVQKEIDNLESDLETKEVQRLQTEANTSLAESQEDRINLAYGRDIVDTVTGIAGTGASLYSSKALADVAKANAAVNARNATVNEKRLDSHTTETRYDKKGKPVGRVERSSFSHGVPTVDSSASPKTKPDAHGLLGSSAKSVGTVAKQVAKELLFLAPAAAGAYGVGKLQESADRRIKADRTSNYGKGYKHFVPRLGL